MSQPDDPSLTADSSPDPEIVRKVAEALNKARRGDLGNTQLAELLLAVAEPLIREQIAQEIEASRVTNTWRTTVPERAAKIARAGQ